jgi:plastocyanin
MRARAAAFIFLAVGLLTPWDASAQYDEDPDPGPEPGASCQAGDVVISTQGTPTRFVPSSVTINTSQTVCIRNASSIEHNFHVPGVIRCAGACSSPYSGSDPGSDPRGNWVTRLSFAEPGTLGYRCDFHYLDGMTGQIIVQGPAGGQPGSFSFTGANFGAGEAAGSATITVRRTGGDTGAASVHYATGGGTAAAGSDFTPASGTLSWPDGNAANKTFAIPILNDTADEPNETVQISLDSPTGGATLGSPSTAVLTINDNDGGSQPPPGTAPAAPSNLDTDPLSTDEIRFTWKDNSNNETQFTIERKQLGGSFSQIGTAPGNATQFLDDGLDPATYYLYRIRAANAAGSSAFSAESGATTSTTPSSCQPDGNTLCFLDRFQVELSWRFASGQSGAGGAVSLSPRSGAFYFLAADNLELLVKMLNACGSGRYWVFFAATTNVEFKVTVTDTQTGRINTYFNPLGKAALPIQDTDAFATCP